MKNLQKIKNLKTRLNNCLCGKFNFFFKLNDEIVVTATYDTTEMYTTIKYLVEKKRPENTVFSIQRSNMGKNN